MIFNYKLSSNGTIIRSDGAFIPSDPGNRDYAEYMAWLAAGNAPDPVDPPTTEALIAANTAAVQAELDRQAQAKGYDNIVSACSYAAQPTGAPFQSEGAAFLAWRSAVWEQAYATLDDVTAGKVAMPTPEQAVAAMPALTLP